MAHLQSAQSWRWVSADHAAWVEKTWQRWSPSWHFTAHDIAEARATLSQPNIAWAATRYYRSLFTPWQARTRQVYALMSKRIGQPLLLLAGRDDGCMHSDFHERLAKGLAANGQSHVLAGVGHFLQAENPRAVADRLMQFIRDVDNRR
jgi:pimeloyl-ACP methyl ester carboxylesterase